jgi:hypothetical protein
MHRPLLASNAQRTATSNGAANAGTRAAGLSLSTLSENFAVRGIPAQHPVPLSPVTEADAGEQAELSPVERSPVLSFNILPDDSTDAGRAGRGVEQETHGVGEAEGQRSAKLLDVEITDDDLRTELYKKIILDQQTRNADANSAQTLNAHTRSARELQAPNGSASMAPDRRGAALVVQGKDGPRGSGRAQQRHGSSPPRTDERPLSAVDGLAALSKALSECELALDRWAFVAKVRWRPESLAARADRRRRRNGRHRRDARGAGLGS